MILVISGTKEAREIIQLCNDNNWPVMAMAVTKYGKELTETDEVNCLYVKDVNESKIEEVIDSNRIKLVVDTSHPHSGNISKAVAGASKKLQINYIKYDRKITNLPDSDLIHWAQSIEGAALIASDLGKTIFLTTGSHQLEYFCDQKKLRKNRVIVRVLPENTIVKKCQELGFSSKDIVACQGPFSIRFNKEMFKFFKADVIVTKESGVASGTDTKVAAALALNIPAVVIKREKKQGEKSVSSIEEVAEFIRTVNSKTS